MYILQIMPPSIITQDTNNRFVTDTQISTWNNKANTAAVTTSANGLMISTDKAKLDGIEANANKYTHPHKSCPSINSRWSNRICLWCTNGFMVYWCYRTMDGLMEFYW